MIKKSIEIFNGLNNRQFEIIKYLIENHDKSDLFDSIGNPTCKFNELLKYISYLSDFEKYCFIIYHTESSDSKEESFEDAIENILSLPLSKKQRDRIKIKTPNEYFPVKYSIRWFLKNYKNTFLPYGIHDLMINDGYYFRRNEINNPSIYNYFYHIIDLATSNINNDFTKSESEKIEAHNNLIIIINNFENKYNPIKEVRI